MAESKSGRTVSNFSMYSESCGEIDANLFNCLAASSEWNCRIGSGNRSPRGNLHSATHVRLQADVGDRTCHDHLLNLAHAQLFEPAYWSVSINNPPINLYDPEMFAEINVLLDDRCPSR
jgi:hypothetical protein